MNKRRPAIRDTIITNAPFALILICALLPRVFYLDAFLTLDEFTWLDRSVNFLLALRSHDWRHTFQTGHPAVTTMWSGSLGLWLYGLRHGLIENGAFVSFMQGLTWDHQHTDLLPYLRLPIVVVTALGIVGIAYLLTRLFDRRVGLIGGLVLSLDPWHLAHSRILYHDALMTTFMTLSALSLMVYIWRETGEWALLLSGICAGLALLSKTLGLFIFPWAALMFLVALGLQKWPLPKVLANGAVWLLTAWTSFFIPWPAMWLQPAKTLWRMWQMVTTYAINAHIKGQFFMGQLVTDPGPFFYPVVALFAMTPVMMVGLAAILVPRKVTDRKPENRNLCLLLLLYTVAFMGFITLGEKNRARYSFSAVVMLNVIAAIGLGNFVDKVQSIITRWLSRRLKIAYPGSGEVVFGILITLMLVAQGITSLPHRPYYSTYYNPILGGNKTAVQHLLVGHGEGNELAADYLNHLSGDKPVVVASMPAIFAPFYDGQSRLWWPHTEVFTADYAVLHRRDMQLKRPDPDIVRYIRETWPLEQKITLHGLPYVWIYRAPRADWALSIEEKHGPLGDLGVLAYRVRPRRVTAGQRITVTLYLQQPRDASRRFVRLRNPQGTWKAEQSLMRGELSAIEPRTVFEEVYYVDVPTDVESGTYQLELGIQRETDAAIRWLPLPESSAVRE
jgi:hypothetical protein